MLLICFASCKKDRVLVDDYKSMDDFYNLHKEPEQEFIIDSAGSCPLIAKKGTKFCMSADELMTTGGSSISYPFTLKVVELYSIKDMLLWRAPSVSGTTILETSAEIRARTFQNSAELILKPSASYYMEMDTMTNLSANMNVYYGTPSTTTVDWTNSLTSTTANSYFYSMYPARTGWVSAAKAHASTAATTTLTLTSTGTNTQNIEVYLSFSNFKGLIKVNNLVSIPVPVGETVTLIAMALNQNNEYLMQQQTFAIIAGQQIALNMQVVSEAGLLAALDGL